MLVVKIHEKLRMAVETRDITVAKLAARAGIAQTQLNAYIKNGTGSLKIEQAAALCIALGISLDWLVDGASDCPPDDYEPKAIEAAREIGWYEAWRRIVRGVTTDTRPEPRGLPPQVEGQSSQAAS